jgi:hypothetical protein
MSVNDNGPNPARIGGFLVNIGAMKRWQVDDILAAQSNGDTRLFGEIAIARGFIDDAALKRYLDTCTALEGGSAAGRKAG